MHLILLLLFISLFIFSSAVLTQAKPLGQFDGFAGNRTARIGSVTGTDVASFEKGVQKEEEVVEDSDFDDDDSHELIHSFGFVEQSVRSVTHLHQDRGEVLVPCFGMWWPVGGPTYDYTTDEDEENKKKRRRSRKQKKSARMKRKKS